MSLTIERKEGEFFSGLIIVRSLPYHKFWILKYQIIKVDSSASVRLSRVELSSSTFQCCPLNLYKISSGRKTKKF